MSQSIYKSPGFVPIEFAYRQLREENWLDDLQAAAWDIAGNTINFASYDDDRRLTLLAEGEIKNMQAAAKAPGLFIEKGRIPETFATGLEDIHPTRLAVRRVKKCLDALVICIEPHPVIADEVSSFTEGIDTTMNISLPWSDGMPVKIPVAAVTKPIARGRLDEMGKVLPPAIGLMPGVVK